MFCVTSQVLRHLARHKQSQRPVTSSFDQETGVSRISDQSRQSQHKLATTLLHSQERVLILLQRSDLIYSERLQPRVILNETMNFKKCSDTGRFSLIKNLKLIQCLKASNRWTNNCPMAVAVFVF